MRILILLCSCSIWFAAQGQVPTDGLLSYYSFDDGTATDQAGNSNGVLSDIPPTLGCGVLGNALFFDGEENFVDLLGSVSDGDYFQDRGRFTVSFFFQADSPFGTHDILSKRTNCNPENAFAIRYTPASRTISIEITENASRSAQIVHQVSESHCWIHIAIAKSENAQRLYINGEFVENAGIMANIDLTSAANLKIADSPCLGTTDRRFSGLLDELRFYLRPLREEEIRNLYLASDQIRTSDTTVYLGDDLILVGEASCATMYNWLPAGDLATPSELVTRASPDQTTTYFLEYLYDNCTAMDSVVVRVIDPSEVNCGKVPMPTAFSPNSDGRNDEFYISNPFSIQTLERFEIFDKWGNKVFETNNINERWDGSYHGQMVNPGIFIYKLKYSCGGDDLTASGSVMVLR